MGLKDKLELLKLLKLRQGRTQHNMNLGDDSLLECLQSKPGSSSSVPPAQSDIFLLSHRHCPLCLWELWLGDSRGQQATQKHHQNC